jgi:hypothetical protein
MSSQMDLFVPDPVKKREKPDAAEFEELTPKTIRMIPTAKSAIPMALFIIILWLNLRRIFVRRYGYLASPVLLCWNRAKAKTQPSLGFMLISKCNLQKATNIFRILRKIKILHQLGGLLPQRRLPKNSLESVINLQFQRLYNA